MESYVISGLIYQGYYPTPCFRKARLYTRCASPTMQMRDSDLDDLTNIGKNENVGCDYLGEGDVRTHWILEAEDGPVDLQQYRGQKIR